MTRLATAWLVYRLTHSALLLGVVSFSGQIVSFLLGPFAAVWVERLERRRLLVVTQAAAAVQSLTLAALTLAHVITLGEIIALMVFQGLINAFDMPGRQSFLVHMVDDRDDLANAIAINSSMVNAARLVGPAIGGLIIAAFGEGWCFLIDGVSYFAVIASLLLMRLGAMSGRGPSASGLLEELREGWNYVSTFRPDPHGAGPPRHDLPHGLALLRAAAGVRRRRPAWGRAYARMAHRGLRSQVPCPPPLRSPCASPSPGSPAPSRPPWPYSGSA